MTNEQKYKTAEERIKAFLSQRKVSSIAMVIANEFAHWLALESVEKPKPCPFCESSCTAHKGVDMVRPHVSCDNEWCGYRSAEEPTIEDAIAAHNRVFRAVEAIKKGVK